jgi:dTDP-4-amino-4,6-dideoxygalactose transaminase
MPYLVRIDSARWYTNHGTLCLEFQRRIAAHYDIAPNSVVVASSGTAALVGAILGAVGRAETSKPFCLCPSYTFVATAAAAVECGFTPHLVDVDADTWCLDPDCLLNHPDLERVGLVIPVATYGEPVLQERWIAFQKRTGIPVVIDGAAAFDSMKSKPSALGPIPVVVSLHATKPFSCGEGGLVLGGDEDLATRCYRALNFGFFDSRESHGPSTNGKLSEYHAAVGLAGLDGWPEKRRAFMQVADEYCKLADELGLGRQLICARAHASAYALFEAESDAEADRAIAALTAEGIEFRRWYGKGLHKQPYYRQFPTSPLPVTDGLAQRLISVPMFTDLRPSDVRRVLLALYDGIHSGAGRARADSVGNLAPVSRETTILGRAGACGD